MFYKIYTNYFFFIIILLLLFVLNSCSQILYSPQVEKRIEIEYRYNLNKDFKVSKWQKTKRLVEYVKYDTNNNVIEIGNYGELYSSQIRTVNSDSSITINHSDSWNFKKLGSVVDYEYNSNGQLVMEESWNMENNKKDYLIWKKLYSYDSTGFLVKEIEYNQNQKIQNIKNYTKINKNLYISTDTQFVYSIDGIQRIGSNELDSIFLDDQNRPIIKIHYFKNEFLLKEKYEYSNSNNLVNRSRYDEKKQLEFTEIYWYNDKNQIIIKIEKYPDISIEFNNIYLYNKQNLLKKIIYFENNELVKYSKFKYLFFKKSKGEKA